jgi:uncharacterized protein (TIGR02996 family)
VLAFLNAIKEQPEDDTPRLILADWLEEHGDPRGELLRLQVNLAHAFPGSQAGRARFKREQELRRLHERDWLGPLAQMAGGWTCQRGLIQLTLPAATFLDDTFAQLAETEVLAWVDGVRLTGFSGPPGMPLAESPLLAGLNLLNLGGEPVDSVSIGLMAASPHVRNLTVLELYDTPIGPEGARTLAASPNLAGLRHLNLDGCHIGEDAILALAQSPHLTRLTTLLARVQPISHQTRAALQTRRGLRVVV